MTRRAFTPQEILRERIIPCGRTQLYAWLNDGTLGSLRVGRAIWITPEHIEDFLTRHQRANDAA